MTYTGESDTAVTAFWGRLKDQHTSRYIQGVLPAVLRLVVPPVHHPLVLILLLLPPLSPPHNYFGVQSTPPLTIRQPGPPCIVPKYPLRLTIPFR